MNNRFGGDKGGRGGFGGGRDRGGRGGFGGGRGGRDFGRPQMHKATCDECGNQCEVPFRPSGDKPVLCSDCFKGGRNDRGDRGDRGGRNFERNDRGGRDDRGERQMFEATCSECGNKCEVPFKPSADKPVFCNECFGGKNEKGGSQSNEQVLERLNALEAKLDRIINLLAPAIVIDAEQQQSEPMEAAAETALEPEVKAPSKRKKKVSA